MAEWTLERSYSFRGQKVRYEVLGEGPAVVLVHGTPFSSYVWHRIAPRLAERRQVFVFDLLGYGQSEKRESQNVSLGVQNEVLTERELKPGTDNCCFPWVASSRENHIVRGGLGLPRPLEPVLPRNSAHISEINAPSPKLRNGDVWKAGICGRRYPMIAASADVEGSSTGDIHSLRDVLW